MYSTSRFISLAVCLVLVQPALGDTRDEIVAALDYYAEVWNEGDLEAIRAYYSPKFVALTPDGAITFEQRLESLQALVRPGEDRGEMDHHDVTVEPLEASHALAYGQVRLRFKDGTELDNWFSTVYVKTPFGWKALFSHN